MLLLEVLPALSDDFADLVLGSGGFWVIVKKAEESIGLL